MSNRTESYGKAVQPTTSILQKMGHKAESIMAKQLQPSDLSLVRESTN
jgi:hypothetical protein